MRGSLNISTTEPHNDYGLQVNHAFPGSVSAWWAHCPLLSVPGLKRVLHNHHLKSLGETVFCTITWRFKIHSKQERHTENVGVTLPSAVAPGPFCICQEGWCHSESRRWWCQCHLTREWRYRSRKGDICKTACYFDTALDVVTEDLKLSNTRYRQCWTFWLVFLGGSGVYQLTGTGHKILTHCERHLSLTQRTAEFQRGLGNLKLPQSLMQNEILELWILRCNKYKRTRKMGL